MAHPSPSAQSTPPAQAKTFGVQLWDAANTMRDAVPPTDDIERENGELKGVLRELFAQPAVPEQMVNANLEGMGYGW